MNLKYIHIGQIIQAKVNEQGIKTSRILNYFDCDEETINKMYAAESIDTKTLLGWCKLLKFDFFRLFVGHLQLYAAINVDAGNKKIHRAVGEFRKTVYSKEIKEFILEAVKEGKMSVPQIIAKYNLPRTSIYNWIRKYLSEEEKEQVYKKFSDK